MILYTISSVLRAQQPCLIDIFGNVFKNKEKFSNLPRLLHEQLEEAIGC